MDLNSIIPKHLMRDSVEGKITGSQGKFDKDGRGYGCYAYKQMVWNDNAGGGSGYEMSFSFSDKPVLMPNHGHRSHKTIMPAQRRRKVRK